MREIKFRAWDRVQEKWIYITLPQGDISWADTPEWNKEDLEPWLRYTGLKDRNGVEIYEGDILLKMYGLGDIPVEVKWNYKGWSVFDQVDERYHNPTHWDLGEVVGNIYENPELLDRR